MELGLDDRLECPKSFLENLDNFDIFQDYLITDFAIEVQRAVKFQELVRINNNFFEIIEEDLRH